MGRILEFKWMFDDTVKSHVWADKIDGKIVVDCIDYDDRPLFNFLGKRPKTAKSIVDKFSQRCFSEGRPDKDELLASLGLREYSPIDIVAMTDGRMPKDKFWIDWIIKPKMNIK